MNFLGHAYFTNGDDEVLAGNLFGDYVKGNIDNKDFPEGIKKGLKYHRALDALCDELYSYQELKKLTNQEFGLYKGIIADIFIDHLLARYWDEFSEISLEAFAATTYERVGKSRLYFPERFIRMFEFMEKDNWFIRNRDLQTIENILKRIEMRFQNKVVLFPAVENLRRKETLYKSAFYNFLNEMKAHTIILRPNP
ncbi:MAG: ACP phosphodiesterase [Bacteroidales bacterium]